MTKFSSQFKYTRIKEGVSMSTEREQPPFEEYVIGIFSRGDDGYHRFTATNGEPMTCKMIREAANKCRLLNT